MASTHARGRRGGGSRVPSRKALTDAVALLLLGVTILYLLHRRQLRHALLRAPSGDEGGGVVYGWLGEEGEASEWEEGEGEEGEGEEALREQRRASGRGRHRSRRRTGGQPVAEEGETGGSSAGSEGSYKVCPSTVNASIPTLEGLSLGLGKGMTWEDVFITRLNHDRLLHHQFAISPASVHWLPPSADELLSNYRWRSCAAVGNSGGLRLAEFGGAINSHDLVLRANQAPTFGYERLVGSKTTFRILNKSWTAAYAAARFKSQGLPMERSVSLVITRSTGKEFDRLTRYLKNYRVDVSVLYLSSRVVSMVRALLLAYRVRLCASGRGPYDGGAVPSSGLVAVLILTQLCQRVTLYGYGHDHPSASEALAATSAGGAGRAAEVPYHYFVGNGARRAGVSVHSWHAEEMLLHQLHREGRVTFCRPDFRGRANPVATVNNRFCGLNPFLDSDARARWMERHSVQAEEDADVAQR
eukprot:jgi/Tetstr1/464261/TSEL_009065.t1